MLFSTVRATNTSNKTFMDWFAVGAVIGFSNVGDTRPETAAKKGTGSNAINLEVPAVARALADVRQVRLLPLRARACRGSGAEPPLAPQMVSIPDELIKAWKAGEQNLVNLERLICASQISLAARHLPRGASLH